MNWRRLKAKAAGVFRRRRAEREMQREMAAHLTLLEDELGRREARVQFGSLDAAAEAHREARGLARLEAMARDFRQAWRSLRRAPAFTGAAVLTLGLALGANLAVFTVVNAVILEPLPYPHAEQLVKLRQLAPGAGGLSDVSEGLDLSASMYTTYADHNHSFSAMGVWSHDTAVVSGHGAPEQVNVTYVSDGVLEALGVPPALGRWLGPEDQNPHGAENLMLTYPYWQERFGGSAHVVGQTITKNGRPWQIVGVMPRGFRVVEEEADLIVPTRFGRSGLHLAGFEWHGIARLKPGATLATADADLASLLPVWMDSWTNGPGSDPHFYTRWRIRPALVPLKAEVLQGVGSVLWAVMAAMGLVMIIAAGNVTNLFLVRAEARQHELAVRAALGAGRGRIAQSLLVESFVVAGASCAVGLALAEAAVRWLHGVGNIHLPRLAEVSLDGRVVAVGVVLGAGAALAAGLIPAWRMTPHLQQVLASEGRSASGSRERRRARNLLAITQMALALALMIAAGLLLRSFVALRRVAPGVAEPGTLQTFRIAVPTLTAPSDAQVMRVENNILDRMSAIPGVRAVGLADAMPMEDFGGDWDIVTKRGESIRANQSPPVRLFSFISPGYLAAAGTQLIAGRDFDWNDLYQLHPVALLSANLAREFYGSPAAAVGEEVSPSGDDKTWYRVIGVVQDVRQNGPARPAPETVYWPALARIWGGEVSQRAVTIAVRSPQAGTSALQEQIRAAVAAVNPDLPIASYRTMSDIEQRAMAVPSFTMVMLALAGGMALILGLIGVYGVLAYEVSRRQREVGIRMALGASRGSVRRLFVGQGMGLALVGTATGLVLAAGLAYLLRSLLFGVGALDPVTFAVIPLVLLGAVAAACYLPARRASGVEAAAVLRD